MYIKYTTFNQNFCLQKRFLLLIPLLLLINIHIVSFSNGLVKNSFLYFCDKNHTFLKTQLSIISYFVIVFPKCIITLNQNVNTFYVLPILDWFTVFIHCFHFYLFHSAMIDKRLILIIFYQRIIIINFAYYSLRGIQFRNRFYFAFKLIQILKIII